MLRTLYAFISFKPLNNAMKIFNSGFYIVTDSVLSFAVLKAAVIYLNFIGGEI